jgi:AraC-like DNA-binding protein
MAEQLENLSIRPETQGQSSASSDLLSHVLAQIRLSGDGISLVTVANGEPVPLAPDLGHVCVVTEGALRIACDDGLRLVAETGDLLLLPRGAGELRLLVAEAAATVVVCRFRFDPDSLRGMVEALPPTILISQAEGAAWLDGVLHFMMIEVSDVQPGAALMISRLIDLAVIRTLRTWVQRGQTSGWLGGLSDERVARTLKAIHEAPMRRWSVDALARIAGMSRSSFSERFTALVGRSPLRYQNEWRLTLARGMLSRRQARIGEIGLSVGYESEAAFSRAYKALFGHSPRGEYEVHDRANLSGT